MSYMISLKVRGLLTILQPTTRGNEVGMASFGGSSCVLHLVLEITQADLMFVLFVYTP